MKLSLRLQIWLLAAAVFGVQLTAFAALSESQLIEIQRVRQHTEQQFKRHLELSASVAEQEHVIGDLELELASLIGRSFLLLNQVQDLRSDIPASSTYQLPLLQCGRTLEGIIQQTRGRLSRRMLQVFELSSESAAESNLHRADRASTVLARLMRNPRVRVVMGSFGMFAGVAGIQTALMDHGPVVSGGGSLVVLVFYIVLLDHFSRVGDAISNEQTGESEPLLGESVSSQFDRVLRTLQQAYFGEVRFENPLEALQWLETEFSQRFVCQSAFEAKEPSFNAEALLERAREFEVN